MRSRIAGCALPLLLSPTLSHALAVILPANDGTPPIWAKSELLDVRIAGPAAVTRIDDVFHNPGARQAEGTLLMTLPKGALVTDFEMIVNGVRTKPEVVERGQARQVYEEIVRRAKDPGLLEMVDTQTFKVRVFPIPADGDIPVSLEFTQPLHRENSLYTYALPPCPNRMDGGNPAHQPETSLAVHLQWSQALGTIYSPTHRLRIDREANAASAAVHVEQWRGSAEGFTLHFAPRDRDVGIHLLADRQEGDAEGHFLLMVHPPEEGDRAKPVPKDVTFVIDVSGSMQEGDKIGEARHAVEQCLDALGTHDRFNVIAFSSEVRPCFEKPVEADTRNREKARQWLESLVAEGGTDINDALQKALRAQHSDDERLLEILFLTDGQPTAGETNPDLILKGLREGNTKGLRVFTLGVGFDVNAPLVDQVADTTRATSTYVVPGEKIDTKVRGLWDAVGYPVMTNLALDINGVETRQVHPREFPDLFRSRDLLVAGTYSGGGTATVTLLGTTAGKPARVVTKVSFPATGTSGTRHVSALWATRESAYLLDQIRLHGETKELKDSVIALGKQYNLVTPYTSYLITEGPGRTPVSTARAHGPTIDQIPTVIVTDRTTAPSDFDGFTLSQGPTTNLFRFTDAIDLSAYYHDADQPAGESAVRAAMAIGEAQGAMTAPPAPSLKYLFSERESTTETRMINGRRFDRSDGMWREALADTPTQTVHVKYLSDAYYRLLEKFTDQREVITLGEKVALVLDGQLVVIGPDGISGVAELPEAWRN